MRYYKIVKDGYIASISTSSIDGCGNITKEEYDSLLEVFGSCQTAPEGYTYCLREDLTWELVEAPQVAESTTWTEETLLSMTNAQLEQILYGYGISASMTKATMVKVILLAQGGNEV